MLMWLISVIPAWIPIALATMGVACFIMGTLSNTLRIAGTFMIAISLYIGGLVAATSEWRNALEKARADAALIAEQSKQENNRLATLLDDQQKLLKEKQRERIKYITKVVTKYDDKCTVPNAAISVLHAASQNTVPSSPTSADGDPSNVALSEVVTNTTENYTTCYEIRDKLIGWQNWYTTQKRIYEQKN